MGDGAAMRARRPAQARVLDLLTQTPEPWTADEVASRLGITVATARKHLDQLVRDGTVRADSERSGRPGRPRLRYRRTAPPDGGYQRLSRMLLEVVSSGGSPEEVGRRLGSAQRGDGRSQPDAVLLEAMTVEGFEPELAGEDGATVMTFHRCPYAAAAAEHPGIVCALHRGFAAGVLVGAGSRSDVGPIEIREPRLAGCRLPLQQVG